jgi:hypothetical protein
VETDGLDALQRGDRELAENIQAMLKVVDGRNPVKQVVSAFQSVIDVDEAERGQKET